VQNFEERWRFLAFTEAPRTFRRTAFQRSDGFALHGSRVGGFALHHLASAGDSLIRSGTEPGQGLLVFVVGSIGGDFFQKTNRAGEG
jgi:hypothetical protein